VPITNLPRLTSSASQPYTFPWVERPDLAASLTPQNILGHLARTGGGATLAQQDTIALNPIAAMRDYTLKPFTVRDTYKDVSTSDYLKGTSASPTANNSNLVAPKHTASKEMVGIAKSYIGVNAYHYGGFDCSKFVQDVARKYGVGIPRDTASQMAWFRRKGRFSSSLSGIQPGDPIYFRSSASGSGRHVGIYIGHGKMIDNSGRGIPIAVRSIAGRNVIGYGSMGGLGPKPKPAATTRTTANRTVRTA